MSDVARQVVEGEVLPPSARFRWLKSLGLTPADLSGRIVTVAAHKGGVGKTLFGLELSYLLGGILVDLDWDAGNASRAWGYREEAHRTAPLLDALRLGRVPRPLSGGTWRAPLVPCHSTFEATQPPMETMTKHLETWSRAWGDERACATVIDTHPGGVDSTFGAVAAAHLVVVPVVLGEREMEATQGLVRELKSYPLLLVPNKVGISPPARYIDWLARIAKENGVPVGPAVSSYAWLPTRTRRMAICASDPVPLRARPLVEEIEAVGKAVVKHVLAA